MRSPVGVCRSVRALVCACTVYVGVCVRLRYQRAGPGPASAQARLFAHSLLSLTLLPDCKTIRIRLVDDDVVVVVVKRCRFTFPRT